MPDYGHDLDFGTFLTPQNQRPQDVVALAQLTERAGLDLATFQDHPYQAAFLDTWTLLSWVAAQTETLRVAPNVLNLPLRQPAVLARAAASLDLLSDGRVELGLGAGAFWDAIAAMGGPRCTPGRERRRARARRSTSSARSGTSASAAASASTASTTTSSAPSAAPSRPTTSRSGSAPTSRGCCGSPAQGGRLAAVAAVPDARGHRAVQRGDRRGGAGRRPRPARDPAAAEHRRRSYDWSSSSCRSWSSTASARSSSSGDDPRDDPAFGEEVAPALREAVERERARHADGPGPRRGGARPARRRHRLRRRAAGR